jgi:hypothetical protein
VIYAFIKEAAYQLRGYSDDIQEKHVGPLSQSMRDAQLQNIDDIVIAYHIGLKGGIGRCPNCGHDHLNAGRKSSIVWSIDCPECFYELVNVDPVILINIHQRLVKQAGFEVKL